ncbi:MAG: TolC family protein [Muribaculaceae bacterium]|nr:TolC family protein [Muribaculaceae bacterium]
MKHTVISLLLLISGFSANATAWSLDSCITYAIEHNLTIKSQDIEQMGGELSVTEAKDRFLPTLSAGANQSWDFGRGLTSENTYANRNTSMFGWNANLSLPLFQGLSAVRQLKYAHANLKMLTEQKEAAKDEVTLSVISYYLQALYSREMLAVNEEKARLSKVQLERQRTLLEAGKVPEVDVIQAEAQVANDELSVVTAGNDYQLALIDLAKVLEFEDVENFEILPLPDEAVNLLSADEVYNNALNSNHSILAARQSIDVADKAITVAKSGYLPRLNFNAGLGSSYYTVSGIDGSSFGKQMRDNFSKTLGFSLSVPIFDAFSTRNQIRQAKVRRLNAELNLIQQQSELHKTIRQAYYQALGAEKKYQAGETAVSAAKAALDAMTEKYNYGKANATEWEQTQSTYITSLAQQVQAKYEMILRNRILLFYNKH